jgi:hypothetical protein
MLVSNQYKMKFNGGGSLYLYDVAPSIPMETTTLNYILRKNKEVLTHHFGVHTYMARQLYATKSIRDEVVQVEGEAGSLSFNFVKEISLSVEYDQSRSY